MWTAFLPQIHGYECPIKNVTGNSNEKIQNKNLFDVDGEITQIGLNTTIINNEINIPNAVGNPASALLGYVKVEANKTYTIKFDLKQGKARVAFRLYDSNKQLINTNSISFTGMTYLALYEGYYKDGNSTTITIPSGYDISYIRPLTIAMNDTVTNIYANYQIEEGSTATSYVPHQEQNLPFTFASGQRLMQDGELQDEGIYNTNIHLELKNKNWVIRNEYDGDSNYVLFKQNDYVSDIYKSIKKCTHFPIVSSNPSPAYNCIRLIKTVGYGINILIQKSIASTPEELKTWLTAQNVIVELELETPETIPYNSTQQAQYEAIKNARSYADVTYITSTSNEEDFDMSVVAIADANKVIESELQEIKSAVIALGGDLNV